MNTEFDEFRSLKITIKSETINRNKLACFRKAEEVNRICKESCPNYSQSWACPPHVTDYAAYSSAYSNAEVYLFIAATDTFSSETNPLQSCYDLLKRYSMQFLMDREKACKGKAIISHTCDLCESCSVKTGEACLKPDDMRYHMTSFGFRVDQICEELFKHSISWGSAEKPAEYVSQVGVVFR